MSSPPSDLPPDTLTQQIGVLTRREVEARILAPMIDALGQQFGREAVVAIVRDTVIALARNQGEALADTMDANDSHAFLETLTYWTQDDALKLDILRHDDEHLDFNVTRCRYAELYRSLGIPELGAILSCNRDFSLIEGFNTDADLSRTQTLMQGASHCNFRYRFPQPNLPPTDRAMQTFDADETDNCA